LAANSNLAIAVRIIELPESFGEKRCQVIDHPTFTDIETVTVFVGALTDINVEFSPVFFDGEREDRTARGFPVVFRMEYTKTVFTEKVTGRTIVADMLVSVLFVPANELLTAKRGRRLREIGVCGKLLEITCIEQDAVMTTPRTLINTFEREIRIELNDDLSIGIDLDARAHAGSTEPTSKNPWFEGNRSYLTMTHVIVD
jgi:hypothetical protein